MISPDLALVLVPIAAAWAAWITMRIEGIARDVAVLRAEHRALAAQVEETT